MNPGELNHPAGWLTGPALRVLCTPPRQERHETAISGETLPVLASQRSL